MSVLTTLQACELIVATGIDRCVSHSACDDVYLKGGQVLTIWHGDEDHGSGGVVWEGRDPKWAGDSHTEYDRTGFIQVALLGNFEESVPTAVQLELARDLVQGLQLPISAHCDHGDTACPGRRLLPIVREWAAEMEMNQGMERTV
jgi:hypothetical protein